MVTAYPSLPPTSAAVNIQIVEPKNFAGGATAGSFGPNGAPQSIQPHGFNQAPTYGQPSTYPAYPGLNPAQQQLFNAYNEAMKARELAEQSRNNYLNLANTLNSQAYWQQSQQPPFSGGPQQFPPFNQSINYPGWGGYQAPLYPQPYPVQPWPPQAPQVIDPNQLPKPEQPPIQAPQPEPTPQQVSEPPKPKAPPEPVDPMKMASIEELNNFIANPATLQEKVNAMEQMSSRGQGNPQTYDLLKREAVSDTGSLTGQALDDANYVKQAALWTLGLLNKSQNASVPTDKLPGLSTIEQILSNKKESPDVQAAAVQALQVIDRPNDKRIQKVLKKAQKIKNPDVQRLSKDALAGKSIPVPNQQTNLMAMA